MFWNLNFSFLYDLLLRKDCHILIQHDAMYFTKFCIVLFCVFSRLISTSQRWKRCQRSSPLPRQTMPRPSWDHSNILKNSLFSFSSEIFPLSVLCFVLSNCVLTAQDENNCETRNENKAWIEGPFPKSNIVSTARVDLWWRIRMHTPFQTAVFCKWESLTQVMLSTLPPFQWTQMFPHLFGWCFGTWKMTLLGDILKNHLFEWCSPTCYSTASAALHTLSQCSIAPEKKNINSNGPQMLF